MSEFKMPIRKQESNKGTFGKVLSFCGSDKYIGAAFLSAKSALKIGAGYSALATTEKVINTISSVLPEVVYLTRNVALEKINEHSVILIGCGLGTSQDSKELLIDVLDKINPQTPLIIDADGLNLLALDSTLSDICQSKNEIIITPHPLEASRLLGCDTDRILNNIEDSAKKLTEKYNCITVLKTHRTIICNKDLTIYRNNFGNSALAKAGSGDVLAGIIAGLLAQKMDGFEAAKLGVYLHSRTGEIASEKLTEYSVLASDLFSYLPIAIKEIL